MLRDTQGYTPRACCAIPTGHDIPAGQTCCAIARYVLSKLCLNYMRSYHPGIQEHDRKYSYLLDELLKVRPTFSNNSTSFVSFRHAYPAEGLRRESMPLNSRVKPVSIPNKPSRTYLRIKQPPDHYTPGGWLNRCKVPTVFWSWMSTDQGWYFLNGKEGQCCTPKTHLVTKSEKVVPLKRSTRLS